VAAAARLLRTGGKLVILDLVRHEQDWVRQQWADQWLGFERARLKAGWKEAGLESLVTERLSGATPELAVLLAWDVRKRTSVNINVWPVFALQKSEERILDRVDVRCSFVNRKRNNMAKNTSR
jgi:hypothetical protein